MKHLLLTIFLIAILFGCTEKKTEIQKNEIVTEEIIICRCGLPIIGINEINFYTTIEYCVPDILKNALDSIITQELKCECYKSGKSGFIVDFQRINSKGKIEISSIIMIQIGMYENCFGYFKYKSHYFICKGDSTLFPLKKFRNSRIINVKPIFKRVENCPSSKSKWIYNYSRNKLELDVYDPCNKSVKRRPLRILNDNYFY